jgi:hypothetical protein
LHANAVDGDVAVQRVNRGETGHTMKNDEKRLTHDESMSHSTIIDGEVSLLI